MIFYTPHGEGSVWSPVENRLKEIAKEKNIAVMELVRDILCDVFNIPMYAGQKKSKVDVLIEKEIEAVADELGYDKSFIFYVIMIEYLGL